MDLLPTLRTGAILVVCAPSAARQPLARLTAELALRGPLTVLDGGNRFQPYQVAHLLRQQTVAVERAAKQIFVRRAFTCYQMLALLEGTPSLRQPYLVLDLLATFYDDHTSTREASRLLELCLRQVQRLCLLAPVLVSLAPPLVPERAFLVERVCASAGRVLTPEPGAPAETQLALFPTF